MKGDTIVIEEHHAKAADGIVDLVSPDLETGGGTKFVLTVAGESGSGKSEVAAAIAERLAGRGLRCAILQQDDYFVYPPKTNDRTRREDISWVGPQEVRLELLDAHLAAFREGVAEITKPLMIYADDEESEESFVFGDCGVLIAEGTYTSLLGNVDCRVFIDRTFEQTRAHREKRRRDASELDPFIDQVLAIEHGIISAHKARADIVVNDDYSVSPAR